MKPLLGRRVRIYLVAAILSLVLISWFQFISPYPIKLLAPATTRVQSIVWVNCDDEDPVDCFNAQRDYNRTTESHVAGVANNGQLASVVDEKMLQGKAHHTDDDSYDASGSLEQTTEQKHTTSFNNPTEAGNFSEIEDGVLRKEESLSNLSLEKVDDDDNDSMGSNISAEVGRLVAKEALDLPHVVFDDLHYRRVCADVHSSILCMTIRFPFEVARHEPDVDFPKPFDDRFYELNSTSGFTFVDGRDLEECRSRTGDFSSFELSVQNCLDRASLQGGSDRQVTAVWTRSWNGKIDFFGTRSKAQIERVHDFFDGQVVLLLGASPTPRVAACLSTLFQKCKLGNGLIFCPARMNAARRRVGEDTLLRIMRYQPPDNIIPRVLPDESITTALKKKGIRGKSQKLTVLVEYPVAHTQTHDVMMKKWEAVVKIQRDLPEAFMNITSEQSRKDLAELGFELTRVIAFDGLPQFFPTETGGFTQELKNSKSSEMFVANEGYNGWRPELGTACRGPLPPTSKQAEVNQLERDAFSELQLDMRFYGKTWHFANQLWFGVKGWVTGRNRFLDCTHAPVDSAMVCVHKFFLQAMIDDHYASLGG